MSRRKTKRAVKNEPEAAKARPKAVFRPPPLTIPPLQDQWIHWAAVFLAVFSVYLYTLPRTATLEDSGMFIMSCFFAGISHPPGYALHTMLGKLFTLIPAGSIAFRVNLLSAFFGALTCCAVWWVARILTGRPETLPASRFRRVSCHPQR